MSDEPTSLHTKKNLGGRPPERGETKRAPISMRTTPTIRAALEDAAERGGRSLAQEIEQRLERSVKEESAYSPDTFDALDLIRSLMERTHERVGASWSDDLTAWEIVSDGIVELLLAYKPEAADTVAPPPLKLASGDAEKLRAYEADLERWRAADRASGSKIMRTLLKARSGQVVDERDKLSAAEGRAERAEAEGAPEWPLSPELRELYDARQAYEQRLRFAQAYASQFVNATRRRRS